MLYKNLPDRLLDKIMILRYIIDYMAAIQLFVTGKPKNAFSVFKARRDFKKMRPDFKEKRKQNIFYSIIDITSSISQKSIILEYYLKRKKTFSELMKER